MFNISCSTLGQWPVIRAGLAALAMAACVGAAEIGPTEAVTGGQVRGRLLPANGGAAFKGIPFAQPPVGDLRWREPRPVAPWSGLRDAGESGPPCAQNSSGWNEKEANASREDCMYLDVWTSEWPPKSRKPVMFWIHGGANTGGAGGSDPLYEGTRITSCGIVLVIADYRLGVFGFLAHPELTRESPHHASGNYGLLDQIAALKWVRDNIAKFGGDPEKVTVFGQSAGAVDLAALMASPLAKGLFHRGIAESGAAQGAAPLAVVEQAGVRLAEGLKAPAEGTLPYLRSLSTAEMLRAGRGGAMLNVDGWVLTSSPSEVFASGKQHRVPLITGSNAIELSGQASPDQVRKTIQARYRDLAPKALALYGLAEPGSKGTTDPLYGGLNDQWDADTGMRCPAVLEGMWHSAAGNPTWEYQFDRAIPPKPTVVHSSELPYVFSNLFPTGSQAGNYEEADRKLSAAMQVYWTNFAKTGDPNGAGLPEWPKFDDKSRQYIEFTGTGSVIVNANQRGAFCDLFMESIKASMATR